MKWRRAQRIAWLHDLTKRDDPTGWDFKRCVDSMQNKTTTAVLKSVHGRAHTRIAHSTPHKATH
eukprot:1144598-Pelagomonas_calceolata.AAC.6